MANFIRITEIRREAYSGYVEYDVIVNIDEISSFGKEYDGSTYRYYMLNMKNGTNFRITEGSYKKLQQEIGL